MYAAVLFLGVQNATTVQPVVAIERTVFYRERAAGMYSALPYAVGQVNNMYKRHLNLNLNGHEKMQLQCKITFSSGEIGK